jgi:calcineurin-like phosphoesterase family protein
MSDVYVISDLHFGHKNILNYRTGFSSIEEHDTIIMDNILSTVGERDTLWMLGDCFFNEESLEYLRRISSKCLQVNLVLGNHDTDNAVRQRNIRTILNEGLVNKIGSTFKRHGAWLTHTPIHPDELRGCTNIHGHVHTATIQDSRYFNACVENINYTPRLFTECIYEND